MIHHDPEAFDAKLESGHGSIPRDASPCRGSPCSAWRSCSASSKRPRAGPVLRRNSRLFWPEACCERFPPGSSWRALFPGIELLARRLRMDSGRWRVSLPVHVLRSGVLRSCISRAPVDRQYPTVTVFSFEQGLTAFRTRYAVTDLFMTGPWSAVRSRIIAPRSSGAKLSKTAARRGRGGAVRGAAAPIEPALLVHALNSISALAPDRDRETLAGR